MTVRITGRKGKSCEVRVFEARSGCGEVGKISIACGGSRRLSFGGLWRGAHSYHVRALPFRVEDSGQSPQSCDTRRPLPLGFNINSDGSRAATNNLPRLRQTRLAAAMPEIAEGWF